MRFSKFLRGVLCALVIALTLGACGQKGDLYLPQYEPDKSQPDKKKQTN